MTIDEINRIYEYCHKDVKVRATITPLVDFFYYAINKIVKSFPYRATVKTI